MTQLQTTINYEEMGEGVTFQIRKGNSRSMGGILVAKFEVSIARLSQNLSSYRHLEMHEPNTLLVAGSGK